MQSPETSSKFGILSLACAGLVCVFWFGGNYIGGMAMIVLAPLCAFVGIVLGVLALRKGDPQRGFAIAGIILSILFLILWCLFLIFYFYVIFHFDYVALHFNPVVDVISI